jgi:hypothetical protein
MKPILCTILVLSVTAAYGQHQPAVEAESTGACSPNILFNQGKVDFTCNVAMDKATVARIVSLLNQVLKNQDSPTSVNQKLDQILEFLQTHTQSPYDPVVLYSLDGMQKRIATEGGSH